MSFLLCVTKDIVPLAWVNIPVFDYKGILQSGEHRLFMWPVTDEDILTEEQLNPIGTSLSLLSSVVLVSQLIVSRCLDDRKRVLILFLVLNVDNERFILMVNIKSVYIQYEGLCLCC